VSIYIKIRLVVPKPHELRWLLPQEKAAFQIVREGIFTLALH
jgi:hypothetical protein